MATRRSEHQGEHYFAGSVLFASASLNSSCVRNAQVAADAAIDASKLLHQQTIDRQLFEPATTIVAKTELLKIVRGATGTVVGFEAAIVTNPTGADRTVSVDLQKSTGAAAFASILTAPISFTDASVDRTAVAASISDAALVDGDLLQAVVTVAGAAGNQALGLVVSLTQIETPS